MASPIVPLARASLAKARWAIISAFHGWLPNTTCRTLAAMTVIADATTALRTDENDPLSLLRGIQATYFELDDEGRAEAAAIMREVSPIAQALRSSGRRRRVRSSR